ncbi:MAG: HAD-IIA family hydrolase [Deinococcota bacterium]|nr:HAD-IIA family hydrolase [Deinococcota bacterium]MDQ3460153.1 HAD-IIA family hydrolase [Deinococcota bacterium]
MNAPVEATSSLNAVHGVILDLDGVVYWGAEPLPGAAEFIAFLARTERRVVALTNHAGATPAAYSEKLRRLGITLPASKIITSAWATARYLQDLAPGAGVWVLGSQALRAALLEAGFVEATGPGAAPYHIPSYVPDYVVVGFDAELHFSKLTQATQYLLRGAELIGCNPDALLPTPDGPVPESGPTLAFLEAASGKKAAVIGKPNPWVFRQALVRLGRSEEETVMVGDTLQTDIAGGRAAGVRTALVLTGNTKEAAGHEATVVARDLYELKTLLEVAS